MKMRPYSGVGRTFANIRIPILLNLTIAVPTTISVYVHTNTTQAAGSRPALHIFGGGANIVKESNGTINAWTQISVTFTPQFTGPVMCWVSCMNTVVNPTTTTTGLPNNRGTVIVYADGFQVI